jgi:hypothetical protein
MLAFTVSWLGSNSASPRLLIVLERVVVLAGGVEVPQAVRKIRVDKVITIKFFIHFLSVIHSLERGR